MCLVTLGAFMWFWSVSLSTNVKSSSHFFWSAKRKLSRLRDWTFFFVHSLDFFLSSIDIREWPIFKKDWTKNSREWTKKKGQSLRRDNFLLANQKKWEIDRTIGRPKRLTKTTWTALKPIVGIGLIAPSSQESDSLNWEATSTLLLIACKNLSPL